MRKLESVRRAIFLDAKVEHKLLKTFEVVG